MKKDSGMWVLLFYISFRIKCEWEKVSGMWGLTLFIEYSNRDSSGTPKNVKPGLLKWDGGSIRFHIPLTFFHSHFIIKLI